MLHLNPHGNEGKSVLVIIDGQVDFTDCPGSALPVPGGLTAIGNVAIFIFLNVALIDAILLTSDKHNPMHIAHAVRWVDRAGNHPANYTEITLAQIDAGDYRAANPVQQVLQRKYVAELEARGEKTLMIWPPHCIPGTPGYKLDQRLVKAVAFWEDFTDKKAVYLDKGEHPDTEQYGAFAAAVPVHDAPATFMNMPVVNWVNSFGSKIWTGLALSHCIMASMQQVFDESPVANRSSHILMTDCTASVPGFELATTSWLAEQSMRGLRTQSSLEDWEVAAV